VEHLFDPHVESRTISVLGSGTVRQLVNELVSEATDVAVDLDRAGQ